MSNWITTQVWIAPGAPATFTKAGYEALTWTRLNGVEVAPTPGIETEMIEVRDLATGRIKVEKGASKGRETEVAVNEVEGDTGQANIKTYASATYGTEISVRIVKPNGTNPYTYMTGLASSYMPNQIDTENNRGFTVNFQQNYDEIETTAP
jgi:hypothetical protein